jgi:hypothetical protein
MFRGHGPLPLLLLLQITRNKAMADILDPEEDESLGKKDEDEEEMGSQ